MNSHREQEPYCAPLLITICSTDDLGMYVKDAEMRTKHPIKRFLFGSKSKPKRVCRIAKKTYVDMVQKVPTRALRATVQPSSPNAMVDAIDQGLVFTHPSAGDVQAPTRVRPSLPYSLAA